MASGYRSHADVLELERPELERVFDRATHLTKLVWNDFRRCRLRDVLDTTSLTVSYLFPDGGKLDVYPLSGAIEATMLEASRRGPIASDERRVERRGLHRELRRLANAIARTLLQEDEGLEPEAVWETKGQSITVKGKKAGPIALFDIVGAFRRHVGGLPVLGRASVHVKLGPERRALGFGVDWRRFERVIAKTSVVSPEEGALRVIAELSRFSPERPVTAFFEPRSFQLGYVSSTRRAHQRTLQPAWVAVLDPKGDFGVGKVIAVPAAKAQFGPLIEPVRPMGVVPERR
jgi:hypothetical protein